MKNTLKHLFEYQQLTRQQARETLLAIADNSFKEAEVAAFITVFQMRDIAQEELMGFRQALLDRCIVPDLPDYDAIDLCGTGGDDKDSFNISTLSAFVVAAAGHKVIKHGNYGVSSLCGSSNVLEALGYQFTTDNEQLRQQLHNTNICFLHAPLFHPAMKSVAGLRRDLGFRSFFNLLGPLVNPVQPSRQLVGVSDLKVARLYHHLLQNSDRKSFVVVHSLDGFDEISLTTAFKHISPKAEQLLYPEDLKLPQVAETSLKGGTSIEEAAAIFMQVLKGDGTAAQNAVVAANAAAAMQQFESNLSLPQAVEKAKSLLLKGKALQVFQKLVKIQSNVKEVVFGK